MKWFHSILFAGAFALVLPFSAFAQAPAPADAHAVLNAQNDHHKNVKKAKHNKKAKHDKKAKLGHKKDHDGKKFDKKRPHELVCLDKRPGDEAICRLDPQFKKDKKVDRKKMKKNDLKKDAFHKK